MKQKILMAIFICLMVVAIVTLAVVNSYSQQTQLIDQWPPRWTIQNPRWAVDTTKQSYYYRSNKVNNTWAYVSHAPEQTVIHDTVIVTVEVPGVATINGKPTYSGINATLINQGYSQKQCDSIWGVGFTNAASNTLDWTVLEYAFRQADNDYKPTVIEINSPSGVIYPIKENKLPNHMKSGQLARHIIIHGNGTTIVYSNNGFIAKATSMTEAGNNVNLAYIIEDCLFKGADGGSAIWIDGSYSTDIRRCVYTHFTHGIHTTWSMMLLIDHCDFYFNTQYDIWAGTGQGLYTGATESNSQSNHVQINMYHTFGGATLKSGIYLYNISTIVINQPLFDAGSGFDYGISVEGCNNSYMKNVDINMPYVEDIFRKAFLKYCVQDGIVNITGGYMQAVGRLFEFNGQTTKAKLNIRDCSLLAGATFAIVKGAQGTILFKGNNNLAHWNGYGSQGISDLKYWTVDAIFQAPLFALKVQTMMNGQQLLGSWLSQYGNTGTTMVIEEY